MTALENVMVGALFGDVDNSNIKDANNKAIELTRSTPAQTSCDSA
jgi:hypothetical protein